MTSSFGEREHDSRKAVTPGHVIRYKPDIYRKMSDDGREGGAEASTFGVLDVVLLVGLVVVVFVLAVRYRRRKNAERSLRKLSINPK